MCAFLVKRNIVKAGSHTKYEFVGRSCMTSLFLQILRYSSPFTSIKLNFLTCGTLISLSKTSINVVVNCYSLVI